MNSKLVRKLIIAAFLLGAVVYLFLTSIHSTTAEPYTVNPAELASWRLVVEEPGRPALVGLQPARQLRHDFYRQVFQRMMISLFQPDLAMPLVLQSEYATSLRASMTADEILQTAKRAGLETAQFTAVCLAEEQDSAPGRSRQFYYVVLESPSFTQVRGELARLHGERQGAGTFDPAALRPMLAIAASDEQFAMAARDTTAAPKCLAPIGTAS